MKQSLIRLLLSLVILAQAPWVLAASGGELSDWYIIPAAAHAPGSLGTYWRTDLSIVNPYRWKAIRVYVRLLITDESNLSADEESFTIAGGNSLHLVDVLDSVFGYTGTGALIVRTKDEAKLSVSARTYTGSNRTYGQTENGQAMTNRGQEEAYITGVRQSDTYRSNFGIVNASYSSAKFKVWVYSANGELRGQETITLQRQSHTQLSISSITNVKFGNGHVKVMCMAPADEEIKWVAYLSVVDNSTGDAVFYEERADRGHTESEPGYSSGGWWSGHMNDDDGNTSIRVYIEQDGSELTLHLFTQSYYLIGTLEGYEHQGLLTFTGGRSWLGECLEDYKTWGTATVSSQRIVGSHDASGDCVSGTVSIDINKS